MYGTLDLHYHHGQSVENLELSRCAGYRNVPILDIQNKVGLAVLEPETFTDHIKNESPIVYLIRTIVLADFELGAIVTPNLIERIISTKGLREAVFHTRE